MNKFYGTAKLEFGGEARDVQVCLNLEQNVIEAAYSMGDPYEWFPALGQKDSIKSPAKLTDIQIYLPVGTLRRDLYDDIFISFGGASQSIYDSILARALNLRGTQEGIIRLIIHPKNSRVEFEFTPYVQESDRFELFYCGMKARFATPRQIRIGTMELVVAGDENGIMVRAGASLWDAEEIFRLSWGIAQGGPVTLRSLLDGRRLIVNMTTHKGSGVGPLFQKEDDGAVLLQGLLDFFVSLSKEEKKRWCKATYSYLEGIGGFASLEIRAINLFTFVETIDETARLDKNSVAQLLAIQNDEADLICKVRHRLIHGGENLGAALFDAYQQLLKYKQNIANTVFLIDPGDKQKTGIHFFFRLASLINGIWISKAKFTRRWNDYSEYLI